MQWSEVIMKRIEALWKRAKEQITYITVNFKWENLLAETLNKRVTYSLSVSDETMFTSMNQIVKIPYFDITVWGTTKYTLLVCLKIPNSSLVASEQVEVNSKHMKTCMNNSSIALLNDLWTTKYSNTQIVCFIDQLIDWLIDWLIDNKVTVECQYTWTGKACSMFPVEHQQTN